jgi:hypothetical protein
MPPDQPAGPKHGARAAGAFLRGHHRGVALVLLLFCVLSTLRDLHSPGSDLAPSYMACRVMANGAQDHLYVHDPVLFNHVYDPAWTVAAIEGRMDGGHDTPPYVQTPLWAWSLQPLCTHMPYNYFKGLFLVLTVFCLAMAIWLVAGHWAPRVFHPGWIALICAGLYLTEAFHYATTLVQTHILFVLLTLIALMVARRHPLDAGMMLALAAAVKITPGLLVLYWLVTKQWKAAASFVVASLALAGITLAAVGPPVFHSYLHTLGQNSHVLLVVFANQSFAAWREGQHFQNSELYLWHVLRMSVPMRIATLAASVGLSVLGGWMDRRAAVTRPNAPPYGAVFAMVGSMMFATVAWSHYYIVLVVPVMMLADAALRERGTARAKWLAAMAVAVLLLNLYPVSWRMVLMHPYTVHGHAVSLVRSQFYSGLVALLGLWVMSVRTRRAQVMSIPVARPMAEGNDLAHAA